jgi:hypothetical protein
MNRALGTLLATAALAVTAGCGSTTSSTAAGDPSASDPNGTIDYTKVALISMTGGGGTSSTLSSPLDTTAQVSAFVRQFRVAPMAQRVRREVARADVPAGSHLYGAVIAVGCDRPPGFEVIRGNGRPQIVPQEVASPLPECLAAVTTVAIVAVPASAG